MVAITKPMKPSGYPRSYRPISLVCTPFKILERLIYTHVASVIHPLLPREQDGFRRGRSTVDQVNLLTQKIKDSYSVKKKAGAVFINLTAAYATVWYRGLTCKHLRRTGTWSRRSWKLYEIAVLLLPQVLDRKAGYNASSMASHRE